MTALPARVRALALLRGGVRVGSDGVGCKGQDDHAGCRRWVPRAGDSAGEILHNYAEGGPYFGKDRIRPVYTIKVAGKTERHQNRYYRR